MFFSEGKKKNDVEVKIDKFDRKDKKKTLCRLEIKKVFLNVQVDIFNSLRIQNYLSQPVLLKSNFYDSGKGRRSCWRMDGRA